MAKAITLIFDIGKTNKKLFLFDENLCEVYQEYTQFEEIEDDDGFSCEDLNSLTKWIIESTRKILNNPEYNVRAINFSAYGASMVHLDEKGNLVSPFYNYLKPFPEDLREEFFESYHGQDNFSLITASPYLGFLNSGLPLYYLKYRKPNIYKNVYKSVHFPQYLSSLFTGKQVSDYTSLGCHTGLWDFRNNRYAHWVKKEGFDRHLPPLEHTSKVFQTNINGKRINVGIGVHDSSAALIPYILGTEDPFVLVSTGTWNICMNFFNDLELTKSELRNDCLNFLGAKGQSIKTSRLFLGQELKEQALKLELHFNQEKGSYKRISFDASFEHSNTTNRLLFSYNHLKPERFGFEETLETDYSQFDNFGQAYHRLMYELTEIQIASLKLAIGASEIKTIYIDGGFTNNELFIRMLSVKLPEYNIYLSELAMGSALGAAILVNNTTISSNSLLRKVGLKRVS